MPDFSNRSQQIEIMDDLNCVGEVVDQTLRELEIINKLLGGNNVTINGINKLIKTQNKASNISVADLGCGGGDILKLIYAWGKKNKFSLNLIGIDANPHIISFAKLNSISCAEINYEAVDIFSKEFRSRKYDIIIGTLFFHHFTNKALVHFFSQLKNQAQIGIVINDIHRHWLAYYSIKLLTKLFSKSSMVKFDAPLSVLRAFRKDELVNLLNKAGIKNYTLKWRWAFRWQVIISV